MATNSFVRFFGPPPLTTGMAPNTCLLPWRFQPLPSVCEPTKLFIKPRTADFDLAPFTGAGGVIPQYASAAQRALDPAPCFSGARSGVSLEGPFLRYTVTKNPFGTWKGLHNDATMTFFFDLYVGRTILLPFMGSLDVCGQYGGTWDFEVSMIPAGDMTSPEPTMAARGTPLDSDATLTLRIGGDAAVNSSRQFEGNVPGAHSFTTNSSNMATVNPTVGTWIESSPSRGTVGPPPSLPMLNTVVNTTLIGGVASAFGNRVAQHNASGTTIDLGAAGAEGFVQWHLGFT